MSQTDQTGGGAEKAPERTVSREVFKEVVRRRQELKAELKRLKEKLDGLPEDWPERLPRWLELEKDGGGADGGAGSAETGHEQERSAWQAKEREYLDTIGGLTLRQKIWASAQKAGAYDPEDVVALAGGLFTAVFEDGVVRIGLSPEGEKIGLEGAGPDGGGFALDEAVARFLQQKPHLVRAGVRPGSGSSPAMTRPVPPAHLDQSEQARQILAERQRLRRLTN